MKRPAHPDLAAVAAIVRELDTATESRPGAFGDLIGAVVDPDTLTYVADQRALRVRAFARTGADPQLAAMLTALYLEGFVVGAKFAAQRHA